MINYIYKYYVTLAQTSVAGSWAPSKFFPWNKHSKAPECMVPMLYCLVHAHSKMSRSKVESKPLDVIEGEAQTPAPSTDQQTSPT